MIKIVAVVFIALAAIGTFVVTWLPVVPTSDQQLTVGSGSPPTPEPSPTYVAVVAGRAKRVDGNIFSFTTYRAPNGDGVNMEVERRKTANLAGKEVRKQILAAAKVFEDGPFLDTNGKVLGRRIVIERKAVEENVMIAIIRTVGEEIHFIESNSLQTVLDFEKVSVFPDQ